MWLPKELKRTTLWMPRPWLPFAHEPWKFSPCASCCGYVCEACLNRVVPPSLTVTIAGVIEGSCGNCDDLNDDWDIPCTFVCAEGENPDYFTTVWDGVFDTQYCGHDLNVVCQVTWYPGLSKRRAWVQAVGEPGGGGWTRILWDTGLSDVVAEQYSCEFVDFNVPYSNTQGNCDGATTPSTCILNA